MGLCYNTIWGHDLYNDIHKLEAAICGYGMYCRALMQLLIVCDV